MPVKTLISRFIPGKLKNMYWARWRKSRGIKMDQSSNIAIETFAGFDVAFRKGTADESVIREDSFDKDIFFAGVQEYQPKEDDVIIDIGAHIGSFTVLASSKVKRGKVYGIEASEDTFNLLRINVALNRCDNASVHHAAISDKNGTITLHHDIGNWGHTTVKKLSEFSETVQSVTLQAFLEQNGIDKCHFMKLNCEGAEFPILLSTPKDVLRRFGIILVLYHGDLWKENSEDDLVKHLQDSGFQCEIRNQHKKRGWIIAENRSSTKPSGSRK